MISIEFTRRFALFLVITSYLFCSFPYAETNAVVSSNDSEAVIDWVKEKAVPIVTDDPASNDNDLLALKKYIGQARIVSLGEATHGTREFFRMKHRLVKFLVEEMGFTHFGLEASLPNCKGISDYVSYGIGDPEEALFKQGFWTWDTEEVLDLIKWMRQYNEKHENGGQIHFFGYDMQNPRKAAEGAVKYLEAINSPAAAEFRQKANALFEDQVANFWQVYFDYSADQRDSLRRFAESLISALDLPDNRKDVDSCDVDWSEARLLANVVSQCEAMMRDEKESEPSIGFSEWTYLYYRFDQSASDVAGYLAKVAPAMADSMAGFLNTLKQPDVLKAYEKPENDQMRQHWKDQSESIITHLESNKTRYLAETGDSAFTAARAAAGDLIQGWKTMDELMAMPQKRPNIRDHAMAENISLTLKQAGDDAKIILWAHNRHVTTEPDDLGYGSMGNDLKKLYGDDHYVIGFSFNQGSFQAGYMEQIDSGEYVQGLKAFSVDAAEEGTIPWLFARAQMPFFFIDLHDLALSDAASRWFGVEHKMRNIGSGYSYDNIEDHFISVILPEHFDAVIFIDSTNAARPNKRTRDRFHISEL